MQLWATSKLADQIAAGQVSAREKVGYFIFAAVFSVATGYAVDWGPRDTSWLHVYEGIVVCVITFAGAQKVASCYQAPIDGAFFEMAYLLSVPLLIKTTLAAWVAIYGGYWLFSAALPHISADSAESAKAISYWLGRTSQIFPFLVAVAIALVFWFRLAHHVTYIAAKRSA
jgi:hypothetical protein